MRKTLFCGVDLHSNNAMYVITDQQDKQVFKKRLPNRLPVVLESLHGIKGLAIEMRQALEQGKLDRVGELLDLSWELKKRLAPDITNPFIDECYWLARANGALGGKVTGAGGGGFLLFYCPVARQGRVAETLRARGLVRVDFDFDSSGVQVLLNNARVDPSALRAGRRPPTEIEEPVDVLGLPILRA